MGVIECHRPDTEDPWLAVEEAARAMGRVHTRRPAQLVYAGAVAAAIGRDRDGMGILLAEAGTGVGKTLGYLVPACREIARHGGRMLVATHTLALMRQIVGTEAPLAAAACGRTLSIAELRGRRNFASPSRCRALAATLRREGRTAEAEACLALAARAAEAGRAAARALVALTDGAPAVGLVELIHGAMLDVFTGETGLALPGEEICLLHGMRREEQAPYELGRALARRADLLVTTHATAAIALAWRMLPGGDEAGDEPDYRVLVVDEADRWAAAAAGVSMISVALDTVEHAVTRLGEAAAAGPAGAAVEAGVASVRAVIAALRRLAPTTPAAVVAADQRTLPPLHSLGEGLKRLCRAAELDVEGTASAAGLVAEAHRAIARAVRALRSDSGLWIPAWVSSAVQGRPSLMVRCVAPGRLLKRIWTPAAGAPPLARSVILTSASLATPGYAPDSRWTAVQAATGVPVGEDARVHRDLMVSVHPADYGELRARFADPAAPIPSPGTDGVIPPEAARYAAATIAMARAAGGRVLVLTPAYADVEALAGLLPDALLHRRGLALRELLAAYRAGPGACLVTPAAWEGVDLPGLVDQLVITRLPFPHRADPTGAGTAADSVRGMLHRLTQGIGRGIRRPEDRVTVWFADPRMPPPTGLSARTLAVAHPRSSPLYLAAIPARFRRALDRSPEAAAFGVRLGDGPPRSPAALARRRGR